VLRAVGTAWHGLAYELALFGAYTLIDGALSLPFTLWKDFRLEQRFGYNKMTVRTFVRDLLLKLGLGIALGGPIIALVLWLMQAAGASWWLWAWAATSLYSVVIQFIWPVAIAPLFNRFDPLPEGPLVERARALMARCGFRAKGFFVMDGSRRSGHGNAYFTGFGATKRVVFYDTLLAQLSVDEMEAILAHELGHFKHRDIQRSMAISSAWLLGLFALLGWLSHQIGFYAGLNVMINPVAPNDALALLLMLLVLPRFLFFVAPAFSALSRRAEYRADAYARSNASAAELAQALVKIHDDNGATLTPDPVFVGFYYSHPPASARIAALGVAPSALAGAAA
jgi:STE24 endopeptidase